MKQTIKELYPYVIIIIVILLFRAYIATPVRVQGTSMKDTLNPGDVLILNKLNKNYKRFDVVVVKTSNSPIIKRIIGLPGENIEYKNDKLYINGKRVEDIETYETYDFSLKELYGVDKLPKDYYFVMGDNRINSLDSRAVGIGMIKKSNIMGTVKIRLFPFNKIGKFD